MVRDRSQSSVQLGSDHLEALVQGWQRQVACVCVPFGCGSKLCTWWFNFDPYPFCPETEGPFGQKSLGARLTPLAQLAIHRHTPFPTRHARKTASELHWAAGSSRQGLPSDCNDAKSRNLRNAKHKKRKKRLSGRKKREQRQPSGCRRWTDRSVCRSRASGGEVRIRRRGTAPGKPAARWDRQ